MTVAGPVEVPVVVPVMVPAAVRPVSAPDTGAAPFAGAVLVVGVVPVVDAVPVTVVESVAAICSSGWPVRTNQPPIRATMPSTTSTSLTSREKLRFSGDLTCETPVVSV